MKNIVIVNLIDISPYFETKIEGLTQIERICNFSNTLPNVENIVYLLSQDVLGVKNKIIRKSWTQEDFINEIEKVSTGYDNMFYFYGDCPLLDSKLTKAMYDDHLNYYAEYTFADGYPYGLTPEIIDVHILSALKILVKDSTRILQRDSIFDIVKKDINSFELETTIAEKDLRLLRISLTIDNKRNYNQFKRILGLGGKDSKSISRIIENNPEVLFQEPSYVTIEITKNQVQTVNYLPKRKEIKKNIDINDLDIVLQKIKDYSEDCTISFVPEYEPTSHPDIIEIIKKITTDYNFDLYIETSGLNWTTELKNEVKSNKRVFIIITIDTIDPDLYKLLRGDGFAEVIAFSKEIVSIIKDRVWIQATRMKTNEVVMEAFYRFWQEYTEQIIIQKYSNYNESLEDLKVADLSPLKRFPCWHLKKDMHVNTEADVLLCFNDINQEYILGSLKNEEIEVIMERKKEYYNDHIKCEYSDFCRKCDEYYTFNF
ncbi:MAG: spiro-SPASM protein [Spirochaetaceae bacterium]